MQHELKGERRMSQHSQHIRLVRTPVGVPTEADFAMGDSELADPAPGQVLVRVTALSLDPYLRSAMAGRHMSGTIQVGDVVRGEGLVKVLASAHPRMAVGQHWVALCGWRSHALLDDAVVQQARLVSDQIQPQTLALGGLGMPGLTAWAGFHRLAEVQARDTVLVSAATGPVGATFGQLARIAGCRVVGIAGGADKCAWVTGTAGFAACINHRSEDLRVAIQRECPKGVDVYFDNVGGDVLQAAVENLALKARVILCGLMAQYNGAPLPGPSPGWFIKARATVRGLVVYDHWDALPTMVAELSAHQRAGNMHFREDIAQGLASTPAAFERLMRGLNQGKALVVL
jgi:NADPH-dependent curcumin reductase